MHAGWSVKTASINHWKQPQPLSNCEQETKPNQINLNKTVLLRTGRELQNVIQLKLLRYVFKFGNFLIGTWELATWNFVLWELVS